MVTTQARREQLEKIKQFIPLKTYTAIAERLEAEAARALRTVRAFSRAEQCARNAPQVLPREFFEERSLPVRSVRIN